MDIVACRAKHHAKRVRRCQSANSGHLMTLLDLSPAVFRRLGLGLALNQIKTKTN